MKPELTPAQEQVLAFIWDYVEEQGFPPTIREIGEGVGTTSTSTAFSHVQALARKGYLSVSGDRKARALQLHRTVTGRSA